MKYFYYFLGVLSLSGCGESRTIVQKEAIPPASESPLVVESPLVGNWIESGGTNTLVFRSDQTVLVNGNALEWRAIDNSYLEFRKDALKIDLCSYEVSVEGTLKDSISVILSMICIGAGELRYEAQK